MSASPPHSAHEIVIAATLWLMLRYQQTGCKKLARMIEQHLRWMQTGASNPALANACQRLSFEWHAISCTTPPIPKQPCIKETAMRTSHTSSLLVAALVMLRHPCNRNKATARFLLERAAEHTELSPAEREACRTLADDLEIEQSEPAPMRTATQPAKAMADWGLDHRLGIVSALPFATDLKGLSA